MSYHGREDATVLLISGVGALYGDDIGVIGSDQRHHTTAASPEKREVE
jgi:hypothetical protein